VAFLGSPFLEAGGYLDLGENVISPRLARRLERRYRDQVDCGNQIEEED